MLVVTVELWPGGDPTHAKEIASIEIANISNLSEVSNYTVLAQQAGNPSLGIKPEKVAFTVYDHPRRQSVFALLKTILNKLGEK